MSATPTRGHGGACHGSSKGGEDGEEAQKTPAQGGTLVAHDANCYWAFRGEREYKYAPHRVWIQQAPRDAPAVPPQPSWGYFGDDACVQTLANSLDDADASETKLKRDLLARLP